MPIHDQSYRRYGGAQGAAGPRVAGDRAGRHPRRCSRKRAFLGLLLFAWLPFVVRAVQIYVVDELSRRRRCSRRRARRSASSSSSRTSSSSSSRSTSAPG